MSVLINFVKSLGLPNTISVAIIGALPILELRGAIPFGVWGLRMHPIAALISALCGNLAVIIPLLFAIDPFISKLNSIEIGKKWINRARMKGEIVKRLEVLGLFLFVAIPLPGTGAWTGALVSFLFGIKKRWAIPSIAMGVITAGIIVTLFVSLGPVKGTILAIVFIVSFSKLLDILIRRTE